MCSLLGVGRRRIPCICPRVPLAAILSRGICTSFSPWVDLTSRLLMLVVRAVTAGLLTAA